MSGTCAEWASPLEQVVAYEDYTEGDWDEWISVIRNFSETDCDECSPWGVRPVVLCDVHRCDFITKKGTRCKGRNSLRSAWANCMRHIDEELDTAWHPVPADA